MVVDHVLESTGRIAGSIIGVYTGSRPHSLSIEHGVPPGIERIRIRPGKTQTHHKTGEGLAALDVGRVVLVLVGPEADGGNRFFLFLDRTATGNEKCGCGKNEDYLLNHTPQI
jgi:hypothetical protein